MNIRRNLLAWFSASNHCQTASNRCDVQNNSVHIEPSCISRWRRVSQWRSVWSLELRSGFHEAPSVASPARGRWTTWRYTSLTPSPSSIRFGRRCKSHCVAWRAVLPYVAGRQPSVVSRAVVSHPAHTSCTCLHRCLDVIVQAEDARVYGGKKLKHKQVLTDLLNRSLYDRQVHFGFSEIRKRRDGGRGNFWMQPLFLATKAVGII